MLFIFGLSGCGILFGNVKPVTEKSSHYEVLDLHATQADWAKLDPNEIPSGRGNPDDDGQSDIAYQSNRTASIISLNSACRDALGDETKTLKDFTDLLLLGITDLSDREEKNTALNGNPGLETTLQGKLNGEPVKLRTVVTRKQRCVYDLMFISRPEHFNEQVADFDRFAHSFKTR